MGILQARILEWVAFPFSRDLPNPGVEPRSPALQADSLPCELPGKPYDAPGRSKRKSIWTWDSDISEATWRTDGAGSISSLPELLCFRRRESARVKFVFSTGGFLEVKMKWWSLSHVWLFVTHGILQAGILEWVAFPFSRDLPNPGIKPRSLTLQVDSLPAEPWGKPKNTGVGSLSLFQRIFLTQESNWGLLHCRWILYHLSYTEGRVGTKLNI